MTLSPFISVHVPEKLILFDILNAVLYVLRTGAQCRQLPHNFPTWQTITRTLLCGQNQSPHSQFNVSGGFGFTQNSKCI